MARLPWFRDAYMPDWLRIRLIAALPRQHEQNIRKALAALLLTAVQGPVSPFQLDIARDHKTVVSGLVAPLLRRFSRQASQDSLLQDYLFRDFMIGLKPSRLAVRLPSGRVLSMPSARLTRRRFLQLTGFASAGLGGGLLLHRGLRTQGYTVVTVNETGQEITACQPRRNEVWRVDLGSEVSLDLMQIPGGAFEMGSPEGEEGRDWYGEWNEFLQGVNVEGPQRTVTVPTVWMGKLSRHASAVAGCGGVAKRRT